MPTLFIYGKSTDFIHFSADIWLISLKIDVRSSRFDQLTRQTGPFRLNTFNKFVSCLNFFRFDRRELHHVFLKKDNFEWPYLKIHSHFEMHVLAYNCIGIFKLMHKNIYKVTDNNKK
jgi:hypothetical protein